MSTSSITLALALLAGVVSSAIGLIWAPDLNTGLISSSAYYYIALCYWSVCPFFVYLAFNLTPASAGKDSTYFRSVAAFIALLNYFSVTAYFFKYPFFLRETHIFWMLSLLQFAAMAGLMLIAYTTVRAARSQTSIQDITASRKRLLEIQVDDFASFLRKKTDHSGELENTLSHLQEEIRLLPSFLSDNQFTLITRKMDEYLSTEKRIFSDFDMHEPTAKEKLKDFDSRSKVFIRNLQKLN